jgi:N-acetylglucosamine-6-phosphate deacetylase
VASEPDRGQTIVDLGQRGYLAPGLVDTHLHGALGRDVMEASPDALDIISRFLVRHGVTTWLPTTLACPASELTLTLQAVRARMNLASHPGAKVAGAHLESNFLAARHVGAQPPEYLASPSDPRLRKVLELHVDAIRIVTLAPELPEALDLVRWLVSKGIVVSIGHTDATHDQVLEASRAGASRITHLCNAQRGLHHREPGVVGAALTQDTLTCEVIADGIHIHPVVLDLIARCKGPQGTALVTDSLPGTGLGPGLHAFGNRQVRIHDGVARLDDGTLAGSILTLDAAVRHAVKWMRVDVQAAIRMASETPARSAGLLDIGTLEPGKRADLVWFDDDIGVQRTWIDGQLVHQLEGLTP